MSTLWRAACRLLIAVIFAAAGSLVGNALASESKFSVPPQADSTAGPARTRADVLRAQLQRHDELYHREGRPEISDFEYDEMKRELASLNASEQQAVEEPESDENSDDRSTAKGSLRHRVRMLGLEKAYRKGELLSFIERAEKKLGRSITRFVVEPKFDGIAISATYVNGMLSTVATRGDGTEGEDITPIARHIENLPESLRGSLVTPTPGYVELRGEAYLPLDEFKRINEARESAGESIYVSPRNLAAGSLKSLDPDALSSRKLKVVFYGIGFIEPVEASPATEVLLLEAMERWGIPSVEQVAIANGPEELWSAINAMGALRDEYPFPTDGVVVKVDSLIDQRELGATRRAPRWALAYKFAPPRTVTRLKEITLQVGRTGVITPVAELEPVQFRGALVSRASLHNADEIARRDYRVGDHVYVERGGEVIPSLVGVDLSQRVESARPYVFPDRCPGCDQNLEKGQRAAWRCVNSRCPAQLKRRIQHFAACVGITGCGDVMVDRLVDSGLVSDFSGLYSLRRADLLTTVRLPTRRADEVLASIEVSRTAPLWRFLQGFGIPGVGEAKARQLAPRFSSLEDFTTITNAELQKMGLSGAGAAAFEQCIKSSRLDAVVRSLAAKGVIPSSEP